MSEIKVIKDKILVELEKKEDKVESGFVIPNKDTNQLHGKVLKVGKGTKDASMEVEEGDTVIFHKSGCYRIDVEDKEYYVLTQNQVIAILKDN